MATEYLPNSSIQRYFFTAFANPRTVADGVLNSSTTVTSATAAFTSSDVGAGITGTGIPGSTTIASVTNATTVVISASATATSSGVSLTVTRTNPLAIAAFQAALLADWGPSGTVSHQLPSTFQVLVNSNTPGQALVLISNNLIIPVNQGDSLGYNGGNWQVVSAANIAALYTQTSI